MDAPAPAAAEARPIILVERAGRGAALAALAPAARAWAEAAGFSGRLGEALALPGAGGAIVAALVGWGDAAARRRGRFHLAGAAAKLPPGDWRLETPLEAEEAEEAALGWALGAYRYDRFRKGPEAKPRRLVPPEGVDRARIEAIAEGATLARDLVNAPANLMGPEALEAAARALAERFGATVETVAGEELLEKGFPLIHAVGRAGPQAPRLIDLRWGAEGAPLATLVGKGVCFDTGGLDLKPRQAMRLMKKDMGGAAQALAAAHMVMARGLRLRLRVLIPAVENSVSSASFRPGDVLESRKGLTVEIGDTDAEGRLILADALALACEERPALLIDFATLTGAARVALGPDLPALFTDDEALASALAESGRRARDPVWRLPLWDGYDDLLKSPVADLDNAPGGGMAGAVTAALFLRRFVDVASWAHFDVFAWTPKARPGRPQGGECQAARAVFDLLERRHG
jgi:leucyl aminopeptidase